jgi:hypothetical protein
LNICSESEEGMKKWLVLFSAVLAMTLLSFAQDTNNAPTTDSTTVTGCLAGTVGSYTLLDQSGKSYTLAGKTDDLAQHVGHQIELTGRAAARETSSTSSGTTSSAANTATFEVASAKMISDHCADGASAATGDHKTVAVGAWDKGTTNTPSNDPSAAAPATVNQTPATSEAATPATTVNQADTAAAASAADQPAAATAPVPDTTASAAQSADAANPPAEAATNAGKTDTLTASRADTALPQTASPLPLFGLLAVGFLAAGYLTLRTD